MNPTTLKISVITFCQYHEITPDFVYALQESGLVKLEQQEEHHYITNEQVEVLEKFIRMHYDLGINIEGLEVISRLLTEMEEMQQELRMLRRGGV
ncbi:hypothetical protein FCR2A7T_24620 [Flavobacterium cauense R2A-7]|uniref:MerR-like DNA binding protein n=1 Tax=Flavobacterium cauense R2A-7 TaxID=1341154 RepID=V6RX45_9FLAO|nr:chaperone modulator CbpM [Flavobacterium cauense]ESU19048.1 hypothetical protein FCR2A7T_24620 [Flavobacterium cauense R2A-7]KGO82324.1 hypothetical protein Q762_06505 [Flavobacterium cauense R2A-7]TWI15288.1 MerR-like DNA binding protein [Flavobacterium cauense R2A-7]